MGRNIKDIEKETAENIEKFKDSEDEFYHDVRTIEHIITSNKNPNCSFLFLGANRDNGMITVAADGKNIHAMLCAIMDSDEKIEDLFFEAVTTFKLHKAMGGKSPIKKDRS